MNSEDGEDSIEACLTAMHTWYWVSLYNPLKIGGKGEMGFAISKGY